MGFKDPYWTLNEAISWAMWRVPDALALNPLVLAISVPEDFSAGSELRRAAALLTQPEAADEVLRLMQRGMIEAIADNEKLTVAQLAAARITNRGEMNFVVASPLDDEFSHLGAHYRNLRLRSDDVRLRLPDNIHQPADVITLVARTRDPADAVSPEPPSNGGPEIEEEEAPHDIQTRIARAALLELYPKGVPLNKGAVKVAMRALDDKFAVIASSEGVNIAPPKERKWRRLRNQ